MKQKDLEALGFGNELLSSEKETLLRYASHLMRELSDGRLGEAPDEDDSLSFFEDFKPDLPSSTELNQILMQIRNRKDIDKCLIPAMLAATPINEPIDRIEYESIKAWGLLACIGIYQQQGMVPAIREGARRIRLLLMPRYAGLLKDLPVFNSNIFEIISNLTELNDSYKDDKVDKSKRSWQVANLLTLFNDYKRLRLPQNRNVNARDFQERAFQPTKIYQTDGMIAPDLEVVEYLPKPEKDIRTIHEKELVADQKNDSKLLKLKIQRKQVEFDLARKTRQAITVSNRLAMREMRFSSDWGPLTFHEARTALREVWQEALDNNSASLMIVLMLLTGRNCQRLICWLKESDQYNDHYRLNQFRVVLNYCPNLPLHSIQGESSRLIDAIDDNCLLFLPIELRRPVKFLKTKVQKIAESLHDQVNERLNQINDQYNLRLTNDRIAGDLYIRLRSQEAGLAEAALICGHTPEQCPAMYYYAPSLQKINKLYQKAIGNYFKFAKIERIKHPMPDLTGRIGSHLQVNERFVHRLVKLLYQQLINLKPKAKSALFDYHNELVIYTYLLLSLATCHRPVTHPFEHRSDIDLNRRLIWISDKEVRNGLSARLIALCGCVCQQINAYDQHLVWLQKQLQFNNASHLKAVEDALDSQSTYLFLLYPNKVKPLNPVTLSNIMSDRWPIALNWQRHFMRSKLRTLGLSDDEVNLFMGHARFGEEGFGPWSGLSLGHLKKIAATIQDIFQTLEIQPFIAH